MERNFTSHITGRRAAPMLALVIPAALAGIALSSHDVSAAQPKAEVSYAKAQRALQAGKMDKAINYAEAAVAADPLNADYRAMLGAVYLSAGRFMAAATSFEDALDLGQEDARTVLSYALAKTAIGDQRVAVTALDEARTRLNPADYGLALALAGQADRGVQVLIAAVRGGDPSPKVRQNLAYAYALSGNWSGARVMASEDVPAGQLDARMTQWAATAAPEMYQQRVADLLKVSAVDDLGQPAQLALANFLQDGPAMAASEPAEPAIAVLPPRVSQTEAMAFGMNDARPAQPAAKQIERIDPTPTPVVSPVRAVAAQPEAPAPAKAVTGIRFVSSPVVQALPQGASRPASAPAQASAPQPAPQQRRMAATAAASAEPVASDKSLGSHLVQLGSYSSKIEAERGWTMLKAKFPQLANHDVVITEAVVKGRTFFRVAAAGFGPKSARSLCGSLKSAGRGCFAYAASSPPAGAVDKGVRVAARTR